jgi:hypothetical protein
MEHLQFGIPLSGTIVLILVALAALSVLIGFVIHLVVKVVAGKPRK